MENWTSVFTTTEEFAAEEVKAFLEEASIPAVILSHKDSAYVWLGEINVMVSNEAAGEAARIIKERLGE
jgi:hypothetical protein